jgi:hypothetical protein
MQPSKAARIMLTDVLNVPAENIGEQSREGNTQPHLIFMLRTVAGWDNTEKAHRWLGYAQGLAVMLGLATLEEMKVINHEA